VKNLGFFCKLGPRLTTRMSYVYALNKHEINSSLSFLLSTCCTDLHICSVHTDCTKQPWNDNQHMGKRNYVTVWL